MNNFRYDINGLRAYAVAIVILFHFGILGFSGGFIGVDIFFVISGFLMTSIIWRSLKQQKLSILNFYLSRAIRIIPALFVVCSFLLILGWYTLLPNDFSQLAKHILSSINFFSNFTYYKESGYFDTTSHNKALLHTWSLSVEWQFYLIFPIIMTILYKINSSKKLIFSLLLIGTILSFLASIYITHRSSSAGFFLLPTRAWEMLVGGLIYFYSISNKTIKFSKTLEFTGFLIIFFSLIFFDSNTLWPSYNALVPVLGTSLILITSQQNSLFTKPKIFQWLGNSSYSIYLWHWPIVFYLYYYNYLDNILLITIGIILSVLMGYLSFKYVENPTRKYFSKNDSLKNYVIWIISISFLSTISIFIYINDGFKKRFEEKIISALETVNNINPRRAECLVFPGQALSSCTYGSGPTRLLVVGDSHANAMINGIEKALPIYTSLISWNFSGCPAVEGLKKTSNPSDKCGELITETIKKINQYPNDVPVLIVNRTNTLFGGAPEQENINKPIRYITKPYSHYDEKYHTEMVNAYVNTLCKFAQNHKVYVTRPTPEAPYSVPHTLAKLLMQNQDQTKQELNITYKDYMTRSKFAWAAQDIAKNKCGINIIDLSEAFCDGNKCSFIKNDKPLFLDDDHMSWEASLILKSYFKEIFE